MNIEEYTLDCIVSITAYTILLCITRQELIKSLDTLFYTRMKLLINHFSNV